MHENDPPWKPLMMMGYLLNNISQSPLRQLEVKIMLK